MVSLPSLGEALEFVVEVPRGSRIKRRPDGRIHFVSPWPSPFNYGSALGVGLAADGDPLDVLALGDGLCRDAIVTLPVRGVVDFLDAGIADPKVVVSADPLRPSQVRRIDAFFVRYALAKGAMGAFRQPTALRGWAIAPQMR